MADFPIRAVLRAFALEVHREAITKHRDVIFDTLGLMEILAATGNEPDSFLAVLHELENKGFIVVTARAGEDSGFTQFLLTAKGYSAGLPESQKGGLRRSVILSFRSGISLVLGVIAIAACPVAIINFLAPVLGLDRNLAYWVLSLWRDHISGPVATVLNALIYRTGIIAAPVWPESIFTSYVTLGLLLALVSYSSHSMGETFSAVAQRPGKITIRSILLMLVSSLSFVVLWPLAYTFDLIQALLSLYTYHFNSNKLAASIKIGIAYESVLARSILITLPALIFIGFFLISLR
ncbi:MAG: hypothetical protein KKA54_19450 [Proteobacteria bacterium]|nr:hypothetical protein [Pseudomonadota bacterium]